MVHIYYARTKSLREEVLFKKALSFVDKERYEKVFRLKNDEDKRRSLAAGVLEKYYVNDTNVNYNLSHAGAFAACAIAKDAIGVDIENILLHVKTADREQKIEQIMRRSFTQKEQEQVHAGHSFEERMQIASDVWTRKESYAKAYRKGLAMDFRQIDTCVAAGFFTMHPADGYSLSVYSLKQNEVDFLCEEIDLREIIR